MKISKLQKISGIEQSSSGIGVSTSARIYARKFYGSQGNNIWATARNNKINDLLAGLFASAEPKHRFKLKSGEVAEIRQSDTFYFIAAIRGGRYDIIVLQKAYKEADPKISKRRLEGIEWGPK
jgi:hypothetical protein